MTEEKTLSFQGEMELSADRSVQCAATIRYQQWNPETLSVDLLWLGDDDAKREGGVAMRYLGRNHIWLNSLDGHHFPVELLGITGVASQHTGRSVHSSRIHVSAIQVGITKDQLGKDKRFSVTVRLQPSGILTLPTIHNQMFTGEVLIERVEEGVIEFDIKGGSLQARETYEYDKHQRHGDDVTDRIQRASMLGEIAIEKGETLWDFHEGLKSELRVACSALSLCYRQVVDYYEIEYLDINDAGSVGHSIFRRKWAACKRKTPGDELINTRALRDGGLQRLIHGIEASDRSEDIHRAIQFLANSFQQTAETAYFMAFSAMETIVSCCLDKSEEVVAGSSKWKKIEGTLKRAIQNELDSELHESMIEKLPELKRRALMLRIEIACQKYKPKTDDLWLSIPFKEGIGRAVNIRNGLFHAATAKNDSALVFDLIRIRYFSERLLLKLIGWKDGDIWVWYDQQLKWVNESDH